MAAAEEILLEYIVTLRNGGGIDFQESQCMTIGSPLPLTLGVVILKGNYPEDDNGNPGFRVWFRLTSNIFGSACC